MQDLYEFFREWEWLQDIFEDRRDAYILVEVGMPNGGAHYLITDIDKGLTWIIEDDYLAKSITDKMIKAKFPIVKTLEEEQRLQEEYKKRHP